MRLRVLVLLFALAQSAFGEDVLVIGDSHSCGAFGKRLFENRLERGDNVTLYCTPSSSPQHWMNGTNPAGHECKVRSSARPELSACGGDGRTPSLSTLLARHAGARVVVALGTNSLHSTQAGSSYRDFAAAIQASGRACDWIGPPHLNPADASGSSRERIRALQRNLDGFYVSLNDVVSSACSLVDSRPSTAPGTAGHATSDGVHRGNVAGRAWADGVSPSLATGAAASAQGLGFIFVAPEAAR